MTKTTDKVTDVPGTPTTVNLDSKPMKFVYADPPYIGQAHRYVEKTEVDHEALIRKLDEQFGDGEIQGWALSASSPSLWQLLQIAGSDVRVMAWVKPFAVFKPNVDIAYAWEPILVRGGRKRSRSEPTVRDWVSANITLKKGLVGAKPEAFCLWLLEVLNVQEGDELVDMFPGTGSMGAALEKYLGQGRIAI